MASTVAQRTIQSAKRGRVRADITRTRHIQLHNVPKTAQPGDIWRLCTRAKLENVESGNAWVTLTNASFSDSTLKKFHEGHYIGASEISASMNARKDAEFLRRGRGEKGREDAANRGVLGSGPSARISGGEKNVCLSGLPDYTTVDVVKRILKSFKFTSSGEKEVVKLEQATRQYTNSTGRFLVRLASSSEAHRLVRKLHETDFNEINKNRQWRIKAHIVY
ncbi:hypothetical protein BDY19DRAFT_284731 [Irpex rosettiformis]|uniref:Uncharacterized protein n=1 Tax=Irpex rosettiformis TaxID=378272 RepID=A0ACB8UJQ7_9APHY|nr:hypothetical protein BDY19DRAFT_284731 [Irpex rosettiformis]